MTARGDFNDQRGSAARTVALALALGVLIWPEASRVWFGSRPSFPLVTVVFVGLLTAVVLLWDRADMPPRRDTTMRPALGVTFGLLSAALVGFALARWTAAILANAYRADMLIIIREATQRLLDGGNPYSHYFTYDAPWPTQLGYGPVLWGPYLIPRLLQADLRVVTIVGELFVPAWCGVAATLEATRGRVVAAGAWVAVLVAVLVSIDVPEFTLMGHTAVYWPLFLLFAAAVTRAHWRSAAILLALLIVARTTMVALAPVFLIAAWQRDRSSIPAVVALLAGTGLAVMLPFLAWDAAGLWDSMVTYYVRVIKGVVWVSSDGGARHSIGITGWLLARGLERYVEVVQLLLLAATWALSWRAIRRGARPLPWMIASLLVFSMTTLWPVFYVYYDVLFLMVSAAVAEVVGPGLRLRWWGVTLAGLAVVTVAVFLGGMAPYPALAATSSSLHETWGTGFISVEQDAGGPYVWTKDDRVRIPLPRRSRDSADIVVRCRALPAAGAHAPAVTITLNGRRLWQGGLREDWQTIRFPAPKAAWWVGHNALDLHFALPEGVSPDAPRLAVGISRLEVVPRSPSRR